MKTLVHLALGAYPRERGKPPGVWLEAMTDMLAESRIPQIIFTNDTKRTFLPRARVVQKNEWLKVYYLSYPGWLRPRKTFFSFFYAWVVFFFLKKEARGEYLLNSHFFYNAKHGFFLSMFLGAKHILTMHENPDWLLKVLKKRSGFENRVFASLRAIFRPNSIDIDAIKTAFPGLNVRFVPIYVNAGTFKPLEKSAYAFLNERHGLSAGRMLFLSVGTLDAKKGFDIALDALKRLKDEGKLFYYIIVGKGAFRDNIETQVRTYGMEGEVILIDTVENSELVHYYNRADIYLLPSRIESFGAVLIENLLCGTPAVSTPTIGGRMSVLPGLNGELARGFETDAFYDAVQEACTKHYDPVSIRASVLDKYSRETILEHYREFL